MGTRRAIISVIVALGAAGSILAASSTPPVRVQVLAFMRIERPPPESTGSLTLRSRKPKS